MRTLVLAIMLGAMSSTAAADDATLTDLRLRMLVAEAGWRVGPDHTAMLFAIDRLADRAGASVEATIREHVSEFSRGFPLHRRWILHLTTACTEPEGWPGGDWADTAQRPCFRLVRLIRDYDAGRLRDPCRGEPNQWRSRRYPRLQRAARLRGWRRIGCGPDTLHVFWEARR